MNAAQARALFLDHCKPGDRGNLERHGEKAAVAAIMAATADLRLHVTARIEGQARIDALFVPHETRVRAELEVRWAREGQV